MSRNYKSIDTKLIHAGEPQPRIHGAVSMPVFQSAIYEEAHPSSYDDVRYIRLSNTPNHIALHEKLAALENAEDALVTASGMAAISTALLTVLSPGDHLLVQECVYGGTYYLLTRDFKEFGLDFDFIDGNDPDSWGRKLRPTTRAVYVESMSNPTLDVADLRAVVEFARSHQLTSIIDNTFASPVNFRPPEIGFDLSLHSCTKYLNGHSDIVAGACVGQSAWIRRIKRRLNHLGGSLDPHAAFLLHRGMKTLALRVQRQNQSALELAGFLAARPEVAVVHYPGLPTHPRHALAASLFDGFGGVFSFELRDGAEAADRLISHMKIPINTVSLGGVETLITRPALTTHSGMPPEERKRAGISDGLVRMAVGIESTDELIEDVGRALAAQAETA